MAYIENTQFSRTCGKIESFFTTEEMTDIIKIFSKVNTNSTLGNEYHGIDKNNLAYSWFNKTMFKKIVAALDPNMKLIFSMLLDCKVPFDIHHDLKAIPEENGEHFLSCLIPFSVNDDVTLCSNASTLIFNEIDSTDDEVENNVSNIHESTIEHVPVEQTRHFTLRENLIWHPGDLLWWDSRLFHVSNNFPKNGFKSKQAIVMHTYVVP